MLCIECKCELQPGEEVVEECVNGLFLPPVHRYCIGQVAWLNLLRTAKVRGHRFYEWGKRPEYNDD